LDIVIVVVAAAAAVVVRYSPKSIGFEILLN
jgi:hypothetical protein